MHLKWVSKSKSKQKYIYIYMLQYMLAMCQTKTPGKTPAPLESSRAASPKAPDSSNGGFTTVDGRNPAPPGMYKTL